MAQILVVDDEPKLREALTRLLTHHGHVVEAVESGEAAVLAYQRQPRDLVILDISLPGIGGIETFAQLRACDPQVLCIFITAFGSIRAAVDAIRGGGFDYITKPFDNDDLRLTINRALEQRDLKFQVRELQEDLASRTNFPSIVGRSAAIQHVLRELTQVAASDATVLLLGESGTGKELAARNLHRQSRRAARPFIAVNCAAIPSTLAEAEFFGHERGAFTDAKEARPGRFEQADGGTLFLDEVGDLPPGVQAMLLRALQEKEVMRLGARRPTPVDARVVAATNRDLHEAVRTGQFREDLYWRISGFSVMLPPLRDRADDLDLLVDHLVGRLRAELGAAVGGVTERARKRLHLHRWPGNVRELENVLRRAMIVAQGPSIDFDDLKIEPQQISAGAVASPDQTPATLTETVTRAVAHIERHAIESALANAWGNRSVAAKALGIDRRTLFNKLKRFELTPDEVDSSA